MEHTGERPPDVGRSLFTAFPPSCMKRKDEVRRSSSWETAYGLMENRGAVRRPAALPAHVERLAKALGLEVVVEERLQPLVEGYIQGNAIHLPPSSPDAAMEILRPEPTLEHAQRLWDRAFRAAEQHAFRQNPSVPLPGPEPPARYSIREEIDSSHGGEYTEEVTDKGDIGAEKSSSSSIGRMDLAGKTHPVSGVKFDSNGFPIFESIYSTRLEPQDYMKSRSTHFDRASKALYSDIMNDSNLRSKFAEEEIAIFKEGGIPKVYTWHHHQDEGVMQLVDRKIHRQTGHIGGFGIWGSGN